MQFPGRAILHVDLDAFFVEAELLRHPELRGRPVIIGGRSGRGVVASCSYEARSYGVRSAMPIGQALQLCPLALVLPPDMGAYAKQSALVRDLIAAAAPVFEQASIDEFYLDVSGLDRHIGCWAWCLALRERIQRETGLPLSMGLATNKTVAKVAAGEAKPNGVRLVPAGAERAFLAPLPVSKLPLLGPATEKKLAAMGVRTVGALAALSPALLERSFGKTGRALWERANGRCDNPVTPERPAVSMSTEDTFQTDTADRRQMEDKLRAQVRELGYALRREGKTTSCVAVKLRYDDFETHTKQAVLPLTSLDSVIVRQVLDLFDRLYTPGRPVRLLGVRFSGLADTGSQTDLFNDNSRESRLLTVLDQVRARWGKNAFGAGKVMPEQ